MCCIVLVLVVFFKQKTAYEMRISDWSSDVCSSDLAGSDPLDLVRREIERWRNHFADLDAAAELLADELRLGAGDLYGAVAERLRVKHQLSIRILPAEVKIGRAHV